MSKKKEEAETKVEPQEGLDQKVEAPKEEKPKKKKKKKKKKEPLTKIQRYFQILKWISITWLSIGLVLAVSYKYQDRLGIPSEITEVLFSDLKKR